MNKKAIMEYVRTVIIGLIASLFLAGVATGCSKVIAEHHAKMLAKMTNNARDNEMIVQLIEIYKGKLKEDPGDYNINIRLGNLYELIFNYTEAEKQYNNAIGKAPYGVYSPYFGLASIYIKQKKYSKALNIVKKLENKDYKPLLVAKGDFYMTLGDALWQESKIKEALRQYKLAFFYYKKVDSKKKEVAIDGIVDCYDKMANDDYKKHKYEKAVEHLETSLLYRENPFVHYKLAILYKDFDPVQANKYIEKTYNKDPGIINFDIYEEILIRLVNYYYANGKDIETDLYRHKLKMIRNFQKRYVITEKDVKVNIKKLKYKKNFMGTKYKINMKYNIENTSKYDFNTLYFIIKLRYNNKSKEIYSEKLYSKKEPLKSRTESPEYNFEFKYTDKDDIFTSPTLWLDFYAGKKENMRKIPIYSVEVKK